MDSADETFRAFLGAIVRARRAELKALAEPEDRDRLLADARGYRTEAWACLLVGLD